jgi:predicted GIY-YIG superfamily endonuclease
MADIGVITPAEVEIGSLDQTALYRLYDAKGKLLYVGVTDNLKTRFAQHAKEKSWWASVAKRTVAWYDTREEAEAAEDAAFLAEKPARNLALPPEVGNSRYQTAFRLPPPVREWLKQQARREGRAMTDVVLDALGDYRARNDPT